MLCENCNKRVAEVIIRQSVSGGATTETFLCSECAMQQMGGAPIEFIVKNFMNSIMGAGSELFGNTPQSSLVIENKECPVCGLSYEGFKATGRLGCANCYDAFRIQLIPVMKSVHGAAEHIGKFPKRGAAGLSRMREVEQLKVKLKNLIEQEEFEEAARVRDKIKELSV
ncbi:MAG: UvrB/UvrC motif-containing protein [Clostridiales bacterium]|nr:UvrB/UvrC motif-containing protein [Clostridiales bacterium]